MLALICTILATIGLSGAALMWTAPGRRRTQMREAAQLSHWTFDAGGQTLRSAWLGRFPLFRSHDHDDAPTAAATPDACNVIHGAYRGTPVAIFDCRPAWMRGRRQTCVAFRLPGVCVSGFFLWSRDWQTHWPAPLLPQEKPVALSASAGFSRAYQLFSTNPAATRLLFDPSGQRILSRRPGWHIEAGHDWLLLYRPRACVAAGNLEEFLREAFVVYDTVRPRTMARAAHAEYRAS